MISVVKSIEPEFKINKSHYVISNFPTEILKGLFNWFFVENFVENTCTDSELTLAKSNRHLELLPENLNF